MSSWIFCSMAMTVDSERRMSAVMEKVNESLLKAASTPPSLKEKDSRGLPRYGGSKASFKLLAVARRENTMTVAMANPTDLGVIDSLRFTTGLNIEPAVSSAEQIKSTIERIYGLSESAMDQLLGEVGDDIEYREIDESHPELTDPAPIASVDAADPGAG